MTAAELRQAAETLRERATAATDGGFGWRVTDLPGANEVWSDRDAASHDAFMVATTATRLNPNPGARGHADATYIATMHPGVGLALADWLDRAAWAEGMSGYKPAGRFKDHALNVARLINGGANE